jgi:hypothetical protein
MNNKQTEIAYWVSTVFAAFVGFSGILNVIQIASLVKVNLDLGLPQYLNAISGSGKNTGSITILLQPLKRFHEAAYAGFIFYFSGATYVLIANGNGIDKDGITHFIILTVVVSYLSSLKLGQNQPQTSTMLKSNKNPLYIIVKRVFKLLQ